MQFADSVSTSICRINSFYFILNVAEAGTDRNEEAVGEPLIIVTRMDKYCFTVCIL